MNTPFLKDAFGWGFLLWLFGFAFSIMLFPLVPLSAIGWVILPFGVALAIFVLFRKISGGGARYYFFLAVVWTALAVILDYFFIVKAFSPADGYYKLDVYLYYSLTFLLPLFAAWKKRSG